MLATIPSATVLGVEGRPVTVEVHIASGLPCFTVVGLPDAACREARDRVRAAISSCNLIWPLRRITVNLAPSGMRKAGPGFDLAIAIGVLVAAGEIPAEAVSGRAFVGELGLDGTVRAVRGMVSIAGALAATEVVVAAAAAEEAGLVGDLHVRPVTTLAEVVAALKDEARWPDPPPPRPPSPPRPGPDLADVRGQRVGRWAMEVAAAGGHHVLLLGPPGSGKTMLARRLPGLLPDLGTAEALEVTRVHSAAGVPLPPGGLVSRPPLRAPHHGASAVSLIGGGSGVLRPGEVSLAHQGVLFLDELGEFGTDVLDHLRQPLEEGVVRVARARARVSFPARFQLVAAMNPCPCGEGTTPGRCRCTDAARGRYLRRLSGPLLDRFDLRLSIARPSVEELLGPPNGEPSLVVAQRVLAARQRALERGVRCNRELHGRALEAALEMEAPAVRVLEHHLRTGALSARGLHRVERVARTIADLGGCGPVGEEHVCAALELRSDLPELRLAG